ncbi:hypothetical protein CSW57_09040 [Williamsia muralis]|uniref:Uncharacterized protein n=1 Tax=Williamsia marianensis TaxID=85044 RepID=A0A2G3PKW8_WILMA|nr:hypothetical protein CSW57_09040 [Williamsia marianensis]
MVYAAAAIAVIGAVSACSPDRPPNETFSVQDPFDVDDLDDPSNVKRPDVEGNVVVRGAKSSCAGLAVGVDDFYLKRVDVEVGEGGDGVATRVTWTLSSPIPPFGGTVFVFTGVSADETESIQLRYSVANGQRFELYVLNSEDRRIDLTGEPLRTDTGVVSVVVPSPDIMVLGAGFHWSAEMSHNSGAVQHCPA